jgi:hypothetical protein
MCLGFGTRFLKELHSLVLWTCHMIPELLAEELHSLVLGTWLMMIPELSAEELHCLVLGTLAHDDS